MKVDNTTKLEVSSYEMAVICHALMMLAESEDEATELAKQAATTMRWQLIKGRDSKG